MDHHRDIARKVPDPLTPSAAAPGMVGCGTTPLAGAVRGVGPWDGVL